MGRSAFRVNVKFDDEVLKLLRRKLKKGAGEFVEIGVIKGKEVVTEEEVRRPINDIRARKIGARVTSPLREKATLAAIAVFNEFGTEPSKANRGIPSRPFMRTTLREHKGLDFIIREMLNDLLRSDDEKNVIKDGLERADKKLKDNMKDEIREWDDPPNAELTVAQKGFNDPLVDTGRLSASIATRSGKKRK